VSSHSIDTPRQPSGLSGRAAWHETGDQTSVKVT
jgi:hypothetical protein